MRNTAAILLILFFAATLAAAPRIDGVIGPDEWAGARRQALEGGGEALLLREGDVLYVAVAGPRPGIASLCVGNDTRVSILHASAALGTATYEKDGAQWRRRRNFEYVVRDSPRTGPPSEEEKAKHLAEEGWLANSSRSAAPAREFAVRLTPERVALGVAFLGTDDPPAVSHWPSTIGDDCKAVRLGQGWADEVQRFAPMTWDPIAGSASTADAVEEVRQAEIAFAKAFADRDQAKFFALVADDATFFSPLGVQRGKQAVVARWSRFFQGAEAPFAWGPERVEVTADGALGLSWGPVFDPGGAHVSNYSSIWRRQSDGSWKVVFDGPGSGSASLPDTTPKVDEGFVTADDGAKLHYRKIGAGPVTLIVPLDYQLFDVFKQFSDVATVITYDPRNRGRSVRGDVATATMQQEVKDLEAVRRHFKVEKFVPVGFSYLGKMVILYAAAHPDRVARVVQLGPMSNGKLENVAAVDQNTGAPEADVKKLNELQAAGAMEKSPREYCEAFGKVFRYFLVGNPAHAARLAQSDACTLENEWPARFFANFAVLWPTAQVPMPDADMKKVTMPVLTIHGTKDRNAPYEGGREWAAKLPDARLVTIDGAAHAMWADDPVVFFASIRQFLRGEWPLGSTRVNP